MALRLSFLLALLAVLVAAPAAEASTTIGQTFNPNASSTNTVLQTDVATGTGYAVPTDGVITSWTFQAAPPPTDGSAPKTTTVKLKVGRSPDGTTWTIVGESDYQTLQPGQQLTFPTRVPVKAGDVIGSQASAGGQASPGSTLAFTGQSGDKFVSHGGDVPPGTTDTFTAANSIRVDVAATIEPDVDGDGYGDETQDKCPTDAALQTACSADLKVSETADKPVHHPGESVSFTIRVHNNGSSIASGAQVIADLSPELSFRSAVPSSGTCQTTAPITCNLGDIPSNAEATIVVTAIALRVGTASATAKAGSTTADPYLGNNGGGAVTQIAYLPGRCANVFTVFGTKGTVLIGTPAGDLLTGGPGNDTIAGLAGDDCIDGGPGNDHITGDEGRDTIEGGPGNDRITGGPGRDTIDGGPGADRINVVDGSRDTVDCGPGRDVVTVDSRDRVTSCERIIRAKTSRKKKRR